MCGDSSDLPALSKSSNGYPTFALADRGDCSFVEKVRNMEMLGAALGIVVDTIAERETIVMSDDGTGAGIRIPSMIISKNDGTKLIDFLATASEKDLEQVAIIATFDISRPDNRVEYDVWFSQADEKALDFIVDFARVDKMFGERVLMTPRHGVWNCQECEADFKKKHCFADGKYCAFNANHPKIGGINIIREDLRSQYIYEKYYADPKQREGYWNYIKEV